MIKVPDPGTPEAWIRFEAGYASAVRAAGAPAPRLLGIELVRGRAASVWEWIRGPSMWERIVEAPELAGECGLMLADLQLGLFELVPPVGLPDQRDRLVAKIRRAAAAIDPSMMAALESLPARRGPPRLCHGDIHPANVILGSDGPVVVDWFDASRGDPVADLARSSLLMMPGDGGEAPPHLPGATPALLGELVGSYVDRVQEVLGAGDAELERWRAIEAVARIAEGVSSSTLLEVWYRTSGAR